MDNNVNGARGMGAQDKVKKNCFHLGPLCFLLVGMLLAMWWDAFAADCDTCSPEVNSPADLVVTLADQLSLSKDNSF